MTVGEKIRELRRKNDITQEKLANYLQISSQSVSKWETGNGMPDIVLLVPIANFFGVSLDALFDRDPAGEQAEVEAILEKSHKLRNEGQIPDNLALWRSALETYPRNFRCMYELACALENTVYHPTPQEEREKNAYEAVGLCERILEDCTDGEIRNDTVRILTHFYADPTLPIADEEKAVRYANTAGAMFTSREILLENAYFTDKNKHKALRQRQKNTFNFIDAAAHNIIFGNYESREDEIFALKSALSLWQTLIYDENYLFAHCRISDIYKFLAFEYAELKDKYKTIESLRLAMKHAVAFDNIPRGVHHYTSMFVSEEVVDTEKFAKNFSGTDADNLKVFVERQYFDFIRDDPEFKGIMET